MYKSFRIQFRIFGLLVLIEFLGSGTDAQLFSLLVLMSVGLDPSDQ